MKTIHVLNGDCLAQQLERTSNNKNLIVCRECLINGDLKAENLNDFWKLRAKFIASDYQTTTEEYLTKTVKEFERLKYLPENSEIYLWFENDLFCQANMWFVISLIFNQPSLNVYRVFPVVNQPQDIWRGFGNANTNDLEKAYQSKIKFTHNDLILGKNLWSAYQNSDFDALIKLSKTPTSCFQYLEEVCKAHIERFPTDNSLPRPHRVIQDILNSHITNFDDVFIEFSKREGVYGFGDSQLKNIYNQQINNKK